MAIIFLFIGITGIGFQLKFLGQHFFPKKRKGSDRMIDFMKNHVHGGKEEHTMESRKHKRK
jgi:hypothetical protein